MQNSSGRDVRWVSAVAITVAVLWLSVNAYAQNRQQLRRLPERSKPQPATVNVQQAELVKNVLVLKQVPEPEFEPGMTSVEEEGCEPADPLTPQAKLNVLLPSEPPTAGDDLHNPAPPKLTTITLTPREPYAFNRGSLEFNKVEYIATEENLAYFDKRELLPSYVAANLNLEEGKRYLVDVNLACTERRTFTYGGQETSVSEGSHHLLLVLEPETSGWETLYLANDGPYTFYSMEVTVQE